jgi:hypothetical protein
VTPAASGKKALLCCSFCGHKQNEVAKLIAGPGVYICDACVGLCDEILERELGEAGVRAKVDREGAAAEGPSVFKDLTAMSDDELLSEIVRIHALHLDVDRAASRHIQLARERGVTWARIGEALGMTRQSAWERFSGEE